MANQHPDDPVEVPQRWEEAGAVWHVVGRHGDAVAIGLFTCDGGEEVSRFTARDTDLLRFLAARRTSDLDRAQGDVREAGSKLSRAWLGEGSERTPRRFAGIPSTESP